MVRQFGLEPCLQPAHLSRSLDFLNSLFLARLRLCLRLRDGCAHLAFFLFVFVSPGRQADHGWSTLENHRAKWHARSTLEDQRIEIQMRLVERREIAVGDSHCTFGTRYRVHPR